MKILGENSGRAVYVSVDRNDDARNDLVGGAVVDGHGVAASAAGDRLELGERHQRSAHVEFRVAGECHEDSLAGRAAASNRTGCLTQYWFYSIQ